MLEQMRRESGLDLTKAEFDPKKLLKLKKKKEDLIGRTTKAHFEYLGWQWDPNDIRPYSYTKKGGAKGLAREKSILQKEIRDVENILDISPGGYLYKKPPPDHTPTKRKTRAAFQRSQLQAISDLQGSSVVQYLAYDPEKQIVYFRLGASRRGTRNYHTTKKVPQSVFDDWKLGDTCKTSDKSGLKRWVKGDTGSLGAFYNIFIKGRYGTVRGF